MVDFTFLEENQVIGYNSLSIFKNYGTGATVTDFAILLGCHTIIDDDLRIGSWATKTPFIGDARQILTSGSGLCLHINSIDFGVRPAFSYSELSDINLKTEINQYGIKEVEYGEYPQTVVATLLRKRLENEYNGGYLRRTGKTYTIGSSLDNEDTFIQNKYIEYEYNGSKYVRFIASKHNLELFLSDGTEIKDKEVYWIKVEPIKWLIDEYENIALSKHILLSGIEFDKIIGYKGEFENTSIKEYLDLYFSKDIIPSEIKYENKEENEIKYTFNFDRVTEDEMIKYALESNIAVFLHGKSGDGKSDRVKAFDPNLEIIYLKNATLDSLNGKSVFNSETNEMTDVPPTWYTNIVKKCENEPDKIHIVFFDEITNALPSIQGISFNIVLDKEVNGIWKLPENARIVAAGNDLEESRIAENIVEPLFNRFAHVYIETTVESWLDWASTKENECEKLDYKAIEIERKIHPFIYAYIACKTHLGDEVLRTEYNGKTPNADPRKWEMSSKLLTYTNNPNTLRCLLGKELTDDFVSFCKKQRVTVEDITQNFISINELNLNLEEKYSTVAGLSLTSEEYIEQVRKFVMNLGDNPCELFDTLWALGDKERLTVIDKLKTLESECKTLKK